jgi:hypothetical protein
MIPYPDLVAALEQWRLRNGLPVTGGGVPAAPITAAPIAVAPSAPRSAPPGPAPGKTLFGVAPAPQPGRAAVPSREQTSEPLDLGDADVLDEDMADAGQYAAGYAAPAAPRGPYDDAGEERTSIGGGQPGESPFETEPIDQYEEEDVLERTPPPPAPRRRS